MSRGHTWGHGVLWLVAPRGAPDQPLAWHASRSAAENDLITHPNRDALLVFEAVIVGENRSAREQRRGVREAVALAAATTKDGWVRSMAARDIFLEQRLGTPVGQRRWGHLVRALEALGELEVQRVFGGRHGSYSLLRLPPPRPEAPKEAAPA